MVFTAKYVITKESRIIVFFPGIEHRKFSNYEPVSAGFIVFKATDDGEVRAHCFGRSDSLDISSRPDEDSAIANRQLGLVY